MSSDFPRRTGRFALLAACLSAAPRNYDGFCRAVAAWNRVREQLVQAKEWVLQQRLRELEHTLRLQYRRIRTLRAQLG